MAAVPGDLNAHNYNRRPGVAYVAPEALVMDSYCIGARLRAILSRDKRRRPPRPTMETAVAEERRSGVVQSRGERNRGKKVEGKQEPELPAWFLIGCILLSIVGVIGGCHAIFSQPKYIPPVQKKEGEDPLDALDRELSPQQPDAANRARVEAERK
jgi:hypothetical protein